MLKRQTASIAVIGAGLAGAVCAQALREAGHAVQVFDKARGAGGRLATRRMEWATDDGQTHRARLDHGAVGFTARHAAFQDAISHAMADGWVAPWSPELAPDSLPLEASPLYVPTPDMPAWCRHLLADVDTHWSVSVDRLLREATGWRVGTGDGLYPDAFDAVVMAVPPAQAAPLLQPHHEDWARFASLVPMQPCWTLMGVAAVDAQAPSSGRSWSAARPEHGPLGWVIRNDRRPGRAAVEGQAHWVVHARPGWTRLHLEQEPDWVKQQLSTALADYLGEPLCWMHAVVHRWRYAVPPPSHLGAGASASHWWDAPRGLGVCGDLFGSSGVEGAFLSARALAAAMLDAPDMSVHERQTWREAGHVVAQTSIDRP